MKFNPSTTSLPEMFNEDFLKKHLSDFEFLGFIRQDEALIEADLDGISPYDVDSIAKTNVEEMIAKL